MGMFDTFEYICFHCKKLTYAQTKLMDCTMTTYKKGDLVGLHDMGLGLKDACEHCNKRSVIKIRNNRYKDAVGPTGATLWEEICGNFMEVTNE